jgi:hypothetical protein
MFRKINIKRSYEKNFPDIKELITGRMPYFIYRSKNTKADHHEIPVFVFHQVDPDHLEKQFRFIKSNGYQTLAADDLAEAVGGHKNEERFIAITFDDATWSFWAYAFPLLRKYKIQAILFVSPALIPEDETHYPNLEDYWKGGCRIDEIFRRGKDQPLCTWRELVKMHNSGNVDIQSHSLTHSRVPISNKVEGFFSPDFDVGSFGNIKIPVSSLDDPKYPERKLRVGAPIFKSAPRMACKRRFIENPELIKAILDYVDMRGGNAFFDRPDWRNELKNFYRKWPSDQLGRFETLEEMKAAICWELSESRNLLEKKIITKKIRHFCYPWFTGCDIADRLAIDAKYHTVHYGVGVQTKNTDQPEKPIRIRRISEEYLFRLPGDNRQSLWTVLKNKAQHLQNPKTVGGQFDQQNQNKHE